MIRNPNQNSQNFELPATGDRLQGGVLSCISAKNGPPDASEFGLSQSHVLWIPVNFQKSLSHTCIEALKYDLFFFFLFFSRTGRTFTTVHAFNEGYGWEIKLPNYRLRYLAVFWKCWLCFNLVLVHFTIAICHYFISHRTQTAFTANIFLFHVCATSSSAGTSGHSLGTCGFKACMVQRAATYSFGCNLSFVDMLATAQSLVQSRWLPGWFTKVLKVVAATCFVIHSF